MFAKGDYCLPKFSGIVGRMTTPLDWDRLGRFVRAARGTRAQRDVRANGGPSDETLSKIEHGRWRPTRSVQGTLEKLEVGLGWAPGSADIVLRGGQPQPLTTPPAKPEPRTDSVTVNLDANNGDLLTTLNELLAAGGMSDSARETLESLRDHTLIDRFPGLFEELSHDGKLRVAQFGQSIYQEEQEQHDDMETAPQSDASSESNENEEAASGDDTELASAMRTAMTRTAQHLLRPGHDVAEEVGVDGDENPEESKEIPR